MVGILVSFWDGLFSGAMLVSGRVAPNFFHRGIDMLVYNKSQLSKRSCRGSFFVKGDPKWSPFWLVDCMLINDRFGVPKLEDANKVGYWEMWGEFG